MKRLLVVMAMLTVCGIHAADDFVLADGGRAMAVISVENAALPPATYAATELQKYFKLISGADFAVVTNAEAGVAAVRVGGACADTRFEAIDVAVVNSKTLRVTGEGKRGVIYAAYHLLEELGCGFWGPHNETVPNIPSLAIKSDLRLSESPAMTYRQPFGESAIYNRTWCPKVGINGDMWIPLKFTEEFGGHVQMDMAQSMAELKGYGRSAQLLAEHPEWFALRGGKRTGMQLCAQNPECQAEILRRARKMMEEDPDRDFISISLDDNDQICQCEKCAKLAKDEGIIALALEPANFIARSLAKDYPKLKILVLAYWITLTPPKTLTPEPNVGFIFAQLERNYVWAMSGSPRTFSKLKRWCEIAPGRVWIWDYDTRFHSYPASLPTIRVLMETYKEYRDLGVNGVFAQLPQGAFGDFVDLRCWLLAKGTWNPDLPWKPTVEKWVNGACGKGAPMVIEWLDLLEKRREEMMKAGLGIGVYGQDSRVIIPPELVIKGYLLLNDALKAVDGDDRTTRQVQVLRASPMVMMLTRYYLDMQETAQKMCVKLPERAELYAELDKMARDYGNNAYGEQYDWTGFIRRIRHGETILQGINGTSEKPWTFYNPIAKTDGAGKLSDEKTGCKTYLTLTKDFDCSCAQLKDGRKYSLEKANDSSGAVQIVLRRDDGRTLVLPIEKNRIGGNETAAFLVKGDRAYVAYTRAIGAKVSDVAIGLLEMTGSNPLDMNSWTRLPQPLLVGGALVTGRGGNTVAHGVMNPKFFKSPSGKELWMVYESFEKPIAEKDISHMENIDLEEQHIPTMLLMQRVEFGVDGSVELSMKPELNIQLILPDARSE